MKKILIIIMLLFLAACNSKDTNNDNQYIEPINEQEVFSYLKDDLYNLLYKANGNKEIETYLLEYLGNDLIEYSAYDINDHIVDFNNFNDKKVIIEIAGTWCNHCKEQSLYHNEELLDKYKDITFIQFFNEGNKNQIKAFYAEIGKTIPDNIIVIPEDNILSNLILDSYNPKYYPGFLFFNEGKLSWVKISSLTVDEMDLCYDVAFNNNIFKDDLVDKDNVSIFTHKRGLEDVKNDLSESNYKLLESLDNDGDTIKNTLSFIGKEFDFYKQYENASDYNCDINFLDYLDSDLVVIYFNQSDESKVKLINDFYDSNTDIDIIVLNITDEDNEELSLKLKPKLVSIMNQVPKMFNEVVFKEVPSALYIQKGIITGAFSNINDLDLFNQSVDIFLKDSSIALLKNN